jgi:hypothetical protein
MLHKRRRGETAALRTILLVLMLWGALAPAASAEQPGSTPTPGAPTEGIYIVQAGDTLYSIARKHGVTVDQLVAWNDIPDPSKIKPGQKIAIKESAIGAASQPSSDEDVSVAIRGRSVSWSTSVRTIVVFGAIFLVLIVLLSVVDRFRKR